MRNTQPSIHKYCQYESRRGGLRQSTTRHFAAVWALLASQRRPPVRYDERRACPLNRLNESFDKPDGTAHVCGVHLMQSLAQTSLLACDGPFRTSWWRPGAWLRSQPCPQHVKVCVSSCTPLIRVRTVSAACVLEKRGPGPSLGCCFPKTYVSLWGAMTCTPPSAWSGEELWRRAHRSMLWVRLVEWCADL